MNYKILVLLLFICCISCESPEKHEILYYNGTIYTAEKENQNIEAVAVRNGIISAIGTKKDLLKQCDEATQKVDLKGAFMMPGIIEGHGHFSGLGKSLINLNLLQTKSWDEIVEMVAEKVKDAKPGEWIEGRGWHQEKWEEVPGHSHHGYPYHYELSAVSPDNPVLLKHASGHALFANEKAMEIAGITKESVSDPGGEIVRDFDQNALGVFEERAMNLIYRMLQKYEEGLSQKELDDRWYLAIEKAQKECLQKGITSFQDAGSKIYEIQRFQKLADEGKFDLRLWAMIRDSTDKVIDVVDELKTIDRGNGYFTCNAIKSEIDGALGSYGAWLLEPYDDKPDFYGQNTTDISEVKRIAELAIENDIQLCVHAIGDRGNREMLDLFESLGHTRNKDWRWRMEHTQHVAPKDIPRFAELGVVASMQAVHCTSDSPFVVKRLGEERARTGAYAWRSLIDAGALVTNGTDAPVEDVDPIVSIYSSVTRKRVAYPDAFFPEQSMTREEALQSYTINNAKAAFEEDKKGSIKVGKFADFTVLSKNLLTCEEDEILDTKVKMTIVGGEVKYSNN